jgi:hypothetical protein
MRRWPAAARAEGRYRQGFILVEVMVAVVLLATLLTSLATGAQRALDAAVKLRDKAAALSTGAARYPSNTPWQWGAMIERTSWSPGPELTVRMGVGAGVEAIVGIWRDGWLLGEWDVSGGEDFRLGAATWGGASGRELVVRARVARGGWGPPWRSIIPESSGEVSVGTASGTSDLTPAIGFDDPMTVAHTRSYSLPVFRGSWAESPVFRDVQGVVFVLSAFGPGSCWLECDGRSQSWANGEGRILDVYF